MKRVKEYGIGVFIFGIFAFLGIAYAVAPVGTVSSQRDRGYLAYSTNHRNDWGGGADVTGKLESSIFNAYTANGRVTGSEFGLYTTGGRVTHPEFAGYTTHRRLTVAEFAAYTSINRAGGGLDTAAFTAYTSIDRVTLATFSGYTASNRNWGGIGGTLADQTDLQNALNTKQNSITGGATTITGSDLTASRALVSNTLGKVAVSSVTSTELSYLSGVTSGLQAQLTGKVGTSQSFGGDVSGTYNAIVVANDSHDHTSSTIPTNSFSAAGLVPAGAGSASKVWKTDGSGIPGWRDDATGSSPTFDAVGGGTNTTSTMTVGTGGTLTYSGSGVLNASRYKGEGGPSATEFAYLSGLESAILEVNDVVDNLTAGGTAVPLSAEQGKNLNTAFVNYTTTDRPTSAEVAATYATIAAQSVNILSYIPSNLHEGIRNHTDTTVLDSYIANALATGKPVFAPSGTYTFSDEIAVNLSKSGIVGEGIGRTIFKTSGQNGIKVGVFTWDGSTDNFSTPAAVAVNATYGRSGTTVTVTKTNHGLVAKQGVYLDFAPGGAADGRYSVVSVPNANTFTVTTAASGTITAGTAVTYYPRHGANSAYSYWTRYSNVVANLSIYSTHASKGAVGISLNGAEHGIYQNVGTHGYNVGVKVNPYSSYNFINNIYAAPVFNPDNYFLFWPLGDSIQAAVQINGAMGSNSEYYYYNVTVNNYSEIKAHGASKGGVWFYGNLFGDATVSNVISQGYNDAASTGAGVLFEQTEETILYGNKITVTGVDQDGTGDAVVKFIGTNFSNISLSGLAKGGSISCHVMTNDVCDTMPAAGTTGGTVNENIWLDRPTPENIGTGAGVFKNMIGNTARLRSIKAGANVTVTENADDITITSTGEGGGTPAGAEGDFQINTGGAFGASIFKQYSGATAPTHKISIGGSAQPLMRMELVGAESVPGDSTFMLRSAYSSASAGGNFAVAHNNGTALPTANDRLGVYSFGSMDFANSTTRNGGAIAAYADGNWTTTSIPAYFQFETAPSGSTTRASRLKIGSDGVITIPGSISDGSTTDTTANILNGGVRYSAIVSYGDGENPSVDDFGKVVIFTAGASHTVPQLIGTGTTYTAKPKRTFLVNRTASSMTIDSASAGDYFNIDGTRSNAAWTLDARSSAALTPISSTDGTYQVEIFAGTTPAAISAGDTNITVTDASDGYIAFTEDNVEYIRLTGGTVGFGTTTPKARIDAYGATNDNSTILSRYEGTSATGGGGLKLYHNNAKSGSDFVLPSANDRLGYVLFGAYSGTEAAATSRNGAAILGYAEDAYVGGTDHSTNIRFETTPVDSATRAERLRIQADGKLRMSNQSAPATTTTACTAGTFTFVNDYLYLCTATDTWRRVQITGTW